MSCDIWGIITLIVAPECLHDREVIVEMLISACVKCGLEVVAGLSSELDPLQASAFNAMGGCCITSRQAALMVWYATALLRVAMSWCCVVGYLI